MQTRTRATRFKKPRPTAKFPHSNQQFVGVHGVHHHVGHARFVVYVQYFIPSFAAVGGFIHATFGMVAVGRTLHAHIHNVSIFGINQHAVNVAGIFQTHQLPSFARVQTFINAIAKILRIAGVAFARSRPNHVGVLLINGHRTNGSNGLLVEKRGKRGASVYRFP